MKKIFQNLNNWGNYNKGIIEILILIVAVIGIIPFNRININISSSFLQKLSTILLFSVSIPIYWLMIIISVASIYLIRIKRTYRSKFIGFSFLVGKWRNEWTIDGNTGVENLEITSEGKYLVNGAHWFNIKNFNYDAKENEMTFEKIGVQFNDNRRLPNKLKIKNNELLSGIENNYKIKYIKMS